MTALLALLFTLPGHMGPLHPVERLLIWLIAFGPFVVLGVVVYVVRRRDLAAEDEEAKQ